MVEVADHGHEPVAVIDDQRVEDGRPVAWVWHVECRACRRALPEVQVDGDVRELAVRS